jgi:phage gp36-like protein
VPTVPYCEVQDLQTGNIPAPSAPNKTLEKYIEEAADEIDSHIGLRYSTPVVADETPVTRPVKLLLKRLNAWLASGRFILAADSGGEDDQVHQFGLYLVTQALAALEAISSGKIVLPGIPLVEEEDSKETGPLAAFQDSESQVEGFASVFGYPTQQVIDRSRSPWPYSPIIGLERIM